MLKNLRDYWTIKKSGLFDPVYYLMNYPDVRRADIDPLLHFIRYGWKEGRNPSNEFDTRFYLESNPDVKNANLNPLFHYIIYGRREGRKKLPTEKIKSKNILTNSLNYEKDIKNNTPITILSKPIDFSKFSDISLKEFNFTISIIIPTKNAGQNFEHLLKVLKTQRGFNKIEIIIIDSGSVDNTLLTAKEQDAKIIKIFPEDFSHSYARNLGAEKASGDILFFTVQDALPPTQTWLYEMVNILLNNNVSAVSCAEFPREDADLFYRMICWNHYNFLDVNGKDKIFKLPEDINYLNIRQNGQLSDLACVIPKNIFLNYKYRLNYAEDLDLGIRLIKDGGKISFLGLKRIIHSHNRPASYFLKRGYVDNLFLSEMFEDYPVPEINFKDFIPEIGFTYNFINNRLFKDLSNNLLSLDINQFKSFFIETFHSSRINNFLYSANLSENNYVDKPYLDLLEDVVKIGNVNKLKNANDVFLLTGLINYSNIMFDYLNTAYEIIDETLLEDIKICINKELAQLIGANLAFCFTNSSNEDKQKFNKIHKLLIKGI